MFDFLRSAGPADKGDSDTDAAATSSNHTPKILKSIFTPQTPSPSPHPPAIPRQFSVDSSERGCSPVPKCSPVKNKLRKASSLRNMVKAGDLSSEAASKGSFAESGRGGEMSEYVNGPSPKEKSLVRKRSGSLREKAKALVRKMSFTEDHSPAVPKGDVPPVPQPPALSHSPSVPVTMDFAYLESLAYPAKSSPYGTPNRASISSVRGILKDLEAPASGNSVRFRSRDHFRLITPNTTTEGSFMDALEGSPGSSGSAAPGLGSPSSVAPAAFLAKLHSASTTDNPSIASGFAGPEAGPSRPTSFSGVQHHPRSTGSMFGGDYTAQSLASRSPADWTSSTRSSPSIAYGSPAHSTDGSHAPPAFSPNKHFSYSHTELLSMDMGEVPADMSNLMDTMSRIGDGDTSVGMGDDAPRGSRAPSPQSASQLNISAGSSDIGRTPMPRRWLRHDSPPMGRSFSETSSPRWTLAATAEEESSSSQSSPNTSKHSDCMRVHEASVEVSQRRAQVIGASPGSASASHQESMLSPRSLPLPASPSPPPMLESLAPAPQTPPRGEVTVWATPMTTLQTDISMADELSSPGSSSEDHGSLSRREESRKLIGLGQSVLEASEEHAQALAKKNDYLEALAKRLAEEIRERETVIELLQAQHADKQKHSPCDGSLADALTQSKDAEDPPHALCNLSEDGPKSAEVQMKLDATEAELRDALIRLEAMQHESRASADKENHLRAQCEQLHDQLERTKADKSVMYHHAVEHEIKQAMQQEISDDRATIAEMALAVVSSTPGLRAHAAEHDKATRCLEEAMDGLQEELGQLQRDNESLRESLDREQEKAKALEVKIEAEAKQYREALQDARDQNKIDLDQMQRELEISRQAVTAVTTRGEQAEEDRQCAMMRLDSVKQSLAEVEEALDKAREDLSQKEEDLAVQRSHEHSEREASATELARLQQQGVDRVELEQLRQQVAKGREEAVKSQDVDANRFAAMQDELDKLRREVTHLRSQSASQEVQVVQLRKAKAQLKEDREMLNIALDAKQQELELMKRRFSVRGIAGATPVVNRTSQDATSSDFQNTPAPSRSYANPVGATPARSSLHAYTTPAAGRRMGDKPPLSTARLPERRVSSALGETSRHNVAVKVEPPAAVEKEAQKSAQPPQPEQQRVRTRSQREMVPA